MHTWDPRDYKSHSAAQELWARDGLARLKLCGDERTLDIGCGDGRISAEIAAHLPAGSLLAVDASPPMIAHACKRHLGDRAPNLSFSVADAAGLQFVQQFDLVVSFNCLHWVHDQEAVLAGIARALSPGGRFFLHLGGQGNVAGMRAVVEKVAGLDAWRAYFADLAFPWCFPEPVSYRRLVEEAGLVPERVELLSRQMPHEGVAALTGWLRTTWLPYLDRLPQELRTAFVDEVVAAYLSLRPADEQGRICIDAVRLETQGHRL